MSSILSALIVDGSEHDADILIRELRKGGYEVKYERVSNAKAMDAALEKKAWDIVFSDYKTAGLDCLEALKILQEKELNIPFILISDSIDGKTILACFKAGVGDFITKGDLSRLVPAVSRELNDARTRKDQKRLEKVKDEFIATVSHELRTPLAIIKGAVGNLKDGIVGPLTPQQMDVIGITMDNIDRLSRIIADMLDLSQLESKQEQLHRTSIDLVTLMQETIERWNHLIQEKNLTITTEFDWKVPKIFADAGKIRQVLINILDNAFRFAKDKITLKVLSLPKASLVHVTISDDGQGIPVKDMNLLFDKFMQINRPLGGAGYKGTGLGLVIAKEIIDLHQGKIWAESNVNQGTQFHFTLPAENVRKVAAPKKEIKIPDTKKPMPKILIVDDEKELVRMMEMGLQGRNYKVSVAYDGKDGLKKAIGEHPDLIVLDMVMPDMQGEEVCQKLKKNPETKNIPVIVLTAKVLKRGRNLAKDLGIKDCIPKPFDMQELIKKIQLNLRR